jgi:phosphohistidine phosphatase
MKTLVLIRHAAAADKKISQADSDRSLTTIGQRQAKHIAKQLKAKNCLPEHLICSPAKRTLQTALVVCHVLKLSPHVLEIDNSFYSGDVETILNRLHDCLTSINLLCVVGHNPTLTYLAHQLCAETQTIILPLAGIIALRFEIKNWYELPKKQGNLMFFTSN